MFCPQCEGEFRKGITECPDCEVQLVDELPEEIRDTTPLVAVFATSDPAVLPVVRSLLDETDIPYTIKGEEVFGLFPGTAVGLAIDPKSRAAQVLVPPERAGEARELLSDIEGGATGGAKKSR